MNFYLQLIVGFFLAYVIKKIFLTKKDKQIPGMEPRSKDMGNLEDLGRAGSLHQFLVGLHDKYGKIASFWFGTQQIVSISSPEMFKEQQSVFDRPLLLFQLFEPFIGPNSLQYANKDDGKGRRKEYDRSMSHKAVTRYLGEFNAAVNEIIDMLCKDMEGGISEHALCTHMATFALKVDLMTLFGNVSDDSKITEFHNNYNVCWSEMGSRLGGKFPEPGSEQEENFQTALNGAKDFVKGVVEIREKLEITEENERFIDILIRHCADEDTLLSDAITYVVGGFHTTANSLAWGFYFIAGNSAVQDKLHAEISEHCGKHDSIGISSINKCVYLKQVFDETLRCSVLAPFAARYLDEDILLGGYPIPGGTPIVHALGVSLQNPEYFPEPSKFDPDRFSPENIKNRPSTAFQPFGVGKRICPGHRFANMEAAVCIAAMVRKFEIGLVDGQKIEPVHGLVTHPSAEIMITLKQRH
ncbi:cytochrome P450 20A1-like [Bolinopsis microptera]|uniref:cytochrome P450 20A1-like n=1 Tax=Bolinopsis microptera TaxID=2820187 RepID=UPI00307A5F69